MTNRKRISIKIIADECGCSTATVSRVLNNNGRFSEETRKKVFSAVDRLNYRTNMVAKSLRTNKSNIIGVIVPDIVNEFFASIVLAIERYSVLEGYSVFICNTNEDKDKEELYLRELTDKGVDGIIFVCGEPRDNIKDDFSTNIPIVYIDRKPLNRNDLICIQSDNYKGGYIATSALLERGCKKILLLRDNRQISHVIERQRGYLDALKDYGLSIDKRNIVSSNVSIEAAQRAINTMIEKSVTFDGIFATTDLLAVGGLTSLKKNKIEVPRKVKLIGFDNIGIARYNNPSISTIHQEKDEMGKLGAKMVIDLIKENRISKKDVLLPVKLILRETT